MTTKPEAIAQIEAALLFIDLINSHEHVQVLLQIDAYSTFKKVTEPADMREVLAHIAAQDAEIARLREALEVIVQWDGAGLALCEHHFEQARASLTTKGTE